VSQRTKIVKRAIFVLSLGLLLAGMAGSAMASINAADIMFVVDESGSMAGEHAWLQSMVATLESKLVAAGVGAGVNANRYGLVGFARSSNAPHKILVGGGDWGTAAQLGSAATTLVTSGSIEDGWRAIHYAINNYTYRDAAINFILITDEERDNTDSSLSYTSVLNEILGKGALLNTVNDAGLRTSSGATALGIDSELNSYRPDGAGGFIESLGGAYVQSAYGTTKANYIDMAWATKGAAWDLNQLRAGGMTATSFTTAFVDIKVQEIQDQIVPEPVSLVCWLLLFGTSAAIVWSRRRPVV
jgi:hypothetical protein